MRFARNLALAFVYAAAGVRVMMRQRNPRIHMVAAILVTVMGSWLGVSRIEWAVLVLAMALVIATEAINSSIEALVDLLSPEIRPSAKVAKDVAAGAVLIAAIAAVIVGLLILGPALMNRIGV